MQPFRFMFSNCTYEARFWNPEDGIIGDCIALDTETTLIEPGEIPRLVTAQAYAGEDIVYLIRREYISDFMRLHEDCVITMHNAAFDVAVITAETGFDFDPMIRGERLYDTGLMYRLYRLATVGVVPAWNLEETAKQCLGIHVDKNEDIRQTFGQFMEHGSVDYERIPIAHLKYAAVDAIVTYLLFDCLNRRIGTLDASNYLSHKIQLMGAISLAAIERHGICINEKQRLLLAGKLTEEMRAYAALLEQYGWNDGAGVRKRMKALFDDLKIALPLSPSGQPSFSEGSMAPHRSSHPVIDAKIAFGEKKKQFQMLESVKPGPVTNRVHSRFNTLVETGRTSSSKPNIQNIPRDPAIRACFIPAKGARFLIVDYSQIELCTLAQVCLDRYKFSVMADMINEGRDLHRWFASVLTGKAEADISHEERQRAKACSFGYPGGLGIEAFVEYAHSTYGITIAEEEARIYKQKWMSAFPEMENYMRDTLYENFSQKVDFGAGGNAEASFRCFKRIIRGETWSSNGVPYHVGMLDNAFNVVLPQIAPDCGGVRLGSAELASLVLVETVVTRTGRMRARCSYTKARNTPFQGLAADGAKIALYYLTHAGYKLCNFVHDEFVLEVPEDIEDSDIEVINDIILDAMRRVVPQVRLKTEWVLSRSWSKSHKIREGSRIILPPQA